MSKLIAALDLGTNTFHLLIAAVEEGKIRKMAAEQRHVKLGEGGINRGVIAEEAYNRGIEALRFFKSVIDQHPVESIRANGTAALRSASNGNDFIRQVEQETGISIEIIAGDREAELIYKGVKAAIDLGESSLIMDIGGGSVEFIFCNKNEFFWKKSFPVGAAKLMASFHHSDPISENDLIQVRLHLENELMELREKAQKYQPTKLIGSAGAFETFSSLESAKFGNRQENLHSTDSYQFNLTQLLEIINDIIISTHEDRAKNKLIIPVRTDMIVVASVLTQFILQELKIRKVEMSAFSLKEGLLIDTAERVSL